MQEKEKVMKPGRRPVGGPGWIRIILGLSLSLNLLIFAAAGAALWKFSGSRTHPEMRAGALWPIVLALPRDDRAILRQAYDVTARNGQGAGAATEEGTARPAFLPEFVAALRQEPFDTAPVHALLRAHAEGRYRRALAGHGALVDRIGLMSADERLDYASRIEEMAARGNARRRWRSSR